MSFVDSGRESRPAEWKAHPLAKHIVQGQKTGYHHSDLSRIIRGLTCALGAPFQGAGTSCSDPHRGFVRADATMRYRPREQTT